MEVGRMDFWSLYGGGARLGAVMKYAIFGSVLVAILLGTYYLGYKAGANNTKVEYVTERVVEYVEIDKARSAIYSSANASRNTLLRLYSENKL